MRLISRETKELLKEKEFLKKAIIYILVIVVQFIAFGEIARIFELETVNSLPAFIALGTMFTTGLAFLIKIVYAYKEKHPVVKKLYLPIAVLTFFAVLLWGSAIYYLFTGEIPPMLGESS